MILTDRRGEMIKEDWQRVVSDIDRDQGTQEATTEYSLARPDVPNLISCKRSGFHSDRSITWIVLESSITNRWFWRASPSVDSTNSRFRSKKRPALSLHFDDMNTPIATRIAKTNPEGQPAANGLRSLNFSPYIHNSKGAGRPIPIAMKPSRLLPQP